MSQKSGIYSFYKSRNLEEINTHQLWIDKNGNKYITTILFEVLLFKNMEENIMFLVVKKLLKLGADPRIKCHGIKPDTLADITGMYKIAELLRNEEVDFDLGEFELINFENPDLTLDDFEIINLKEINNNPIELSPQSLQEKVKNMSEIIIDFSIIGVNSGYLALTNYVYVNTSDMVYNSLEKSYNILDLVLSSITGST